MLRFMDRMIKQEKRIKAALLLTFILSSALAFHQTKKRGWQIETEGIVKKYFPSGTSRTRVTKGIYSSYRKQSSAPNVEPVFILYRQLQHKPNRQLFESITGIGREDNAVAVEVYFDSNQKVTGYGSAHTTYVPYAN